MTKLGVTGASGQLGRLVLEELLGMVDPGDIIALAREPDDLQEYASKGINIRRADYDDRASLDAALDGIERLLLISSNAIGHRVAHHRAVISAAERAGVRFIAYTSILDAPNSPIDLAEGHRQTEAALAETGIAHTLLRNGWYNENFTMALTDQIEAGVIPGSQGDGRISSASREDYAIAAAQVLVNADGGEVFELAGDASWSMDDFAEEVSRQSGQDVAYQDMPPAEYAALLESSGIPSNIAQSLAQAAHATSTGTLENYSKTLNEIIGDQTTPVAVTINHAINRD